MAEQAKKRGQGIVTFFCILLTILFAATVILTGTIGTVFRRQSISEALENEEAAEVIAGVLRAADAERYGALAEDGDVAEVLAELVMQSDYARELQSKSASSRVSSRTATRTSPTVSADDIEDVLENGRLMDFVADRLTLVTNYLLGQRSFRSVLLEESDSFGENELTDHLSKRKNLSLSETQIILIANAVDFAAINEMLENAIGPDSAVGRMRGLISFMLSAGGTALLLVLLVCVLVLWGVSYKRKGYSIRKLFLNGGLVFTILGGLLLACFAAALFTTGLLLPPGLDFAGRALRPLQLWGILNAVICTAAGVLFLLTAKWLKKRQSPEPAAPEQEAL